MGYRVLYQCQVFPLPGVPTALMLEYPPHDTLHSFLICKAKARASGSAGMWPGLTNHITEKDIVVACRDPGRSLHDVRSLVLVF